MGVGADGVVALEVSGDEVVGVDEFADIDGLGGKPDDVVELTDGPAAGDGMDGEFVSGGNVRRYGEAQTIERLACGERLEGDHNVVRISEFESPVLQSALKSPVRCWSELQERLYWYDHTLLQLQD